MQVHSVQITPLDGNITALKANIGLQIHNEDGGGSKNYAGEMNFIFQDSAKMAKKVPITVKSITIARIKSERRKRQENIISQ